MATRSGITGAKELERVLRKLPGRLAERELTSAARAGANVIRKEVRARAPESGEGPEQRKRRSTSGKDYGPLKKNIRVTLVKDGTKLGNISRSFGTGASVELAIHNGNAFWGGFLEFGRKPGVSKKGRRYPGMAPQPWFTPAFDTTVRPALAKVGERLGKGLEKTAKELAGPLSKISKSTRRRL